MKCQAEVSAGVCGFTTHRVAAESSDEEMVSFVLETDCQKIEGLAKALQGRSFDAYDEIHKGFEGEVMQTVPRLLTICAGCAVPAGVFKAMQVAARVGTAEGRHNLAADRVSEGGHLTRGLL